MNSNPDNIRNFQNEDININLIFSFFFRNRKVISFFSLFSFILAAFYSITLKRIWEGKFQIVLNSTKADESQLLNEQRLIQNANLLTQIGILESPSTLNPIFEYVLLEEQNPKNNLTFSGWKKRLNIELEEGTTILNISYKDTNKEIIIPVLKNISTLYQEYSGNSKQKSLEYTKKYLLKEIELFKKKSFKSLEAVQEYAIDKSLLDLKEPKAEKNYLSIEQGASNKILLPNIDIENIRVKAANKIRQINAQIQKINQLGTDQIKLQYIGSTIPGLVKEGLPQKLANIEGELIKLRTQYTEKDPFIVNKIEERDLLIELLKNRSIEYLKSEKLDAEALMESAMRPKEVLLEYKKLIRSF